MTTSKKRPVCYIASPYTKGDAAINTRCQMAMFDELMNDGIVWPVAPLMSHFQHIAFPRNYQDWIDYDLALLERYDACLRIDAKYKPLEYDVSESSGADGEVEFFRKLNKPVFYDKETLYAWVEKRDSQPLNVLNEASRLVHGDRGANYGHPGDDFVCTAAIATAILRRQGKLAAGKEVTAEDWALFMVGCKMTREAHVPKPDNRIDGAGYFETLQMLHDRK